MLDELEIGESKFGLTYLDVQNPEFGTITKIEYSYKMRNAHLVSLAHAAQLVAFPRPSVTTSASFEGCLNSRCRNPVGVWG